MITVALNGGLGNQMFQYAAARTLAIKHNTTLLLDIIPLYSKLQLNKIATYRKFELEIFPIKATTNQPLFIHKYLYPLAKSHFYINRIIQQQKQHYVKESSFEFDSTILMQPNNSYLDGFFQSEKYFKSIEPTIRSEFTFKHPLEDVNKIWLEKIQKHHAVSVHIRRGDYLLNQKNLNKHGITSERYYEKAIDYIASVVEEPYFFVFTDDVSWVKSYFKINFPFEIIDDNQTADTSHLDMQLMQACKHNIICNSTFSWWGAWLNSNPQKIVIAPQQWFADTSINSKDIYPSDWIKL